MLIGIDASRSVAAERTGTENYSLYLIRALIDLGQAHRFRLYFRRLPAQGLFVQNDRVSWRVMPFPRLWTHVRLAWEVARHPPDVLYVPSHVLPWLHPGRCVATVHDLGYLHYPEAHGRWDRWYLDWSTHFSARAAQRVVVDSQATRNDLVSCYGIDSRKVVVAYPAGSEGFAPVTDQGTLDAVRRRYDTGLCYFLHVGTLQPRKNLSTLIRALASLVEDGAIGGDVRLVLAGKPGWLSREILELASTSSVRDRLVLTGYVPSEDLPALLSGALAYVLPSWYEGFGLPVLEAMACDTPVICSNVSSLPEVAGDAALLFDPKDGSALAEAMRRIYQDAALGQELVARGGRRVRAFSWRRCAEKVLEALEVVGTEGEHGR